MTDLVRVESIDALRRLRAALCKFAATAAAGLDEAEFEVQHMGFWVKQDQQLHWKRQLTHRTELVTRAKLALKQKESQKTRLGARYSCVDEMKALAAAQRALEIAREKQASVLRWSRVLDEEFFSFQGLTQGLRLTLQTDIPAALAQLDQMIAALDAYALSGPPQLQTSTAPPTEENAAHAEDLPSMARGSSAPGAMAGQSCQDLRARSPSQTLRAATPLSTRKLLASGTSATAAETDFAGALASCGLGPAPCNANDKVVLARAVLQADRVYLERASDPPQDDSGWYVGFADDTTVSGYDALRLTDLLDLRPDWAALLELPAGCLVTFDNRAPAAVYDLQNRIVWMRGNT